MYRFDLSPSVKKKCVKFVEGDAFLPKEEWSLLRRLASKPVFSSGAATRTNLQGSRFGAG